MAVILAVFTAIERAFDWFWYDSPPMRQWRALYMRTLGRFREETQMAIISSFNGAVSVVYLWLVLR